MVKGIVVGASDGRPLAGASAFINGSSQGTVTNIAGEFELVATGSADFELIVSFVGYASLSYKMTASAIPARLRFMLDEKTDEMQSVVVEPIEKNGWEKWGKVFLQNFIGRSRLGDGCTLKNPEVIRFRYNRNTRLLKADALDALHIENRSLGFSIRYQLEQFRLDFSTAMMMVTGYQVFTPMQPRNTRQKERWIAARLEAYQGSLSHFVRSAYRSKVAEEGFEVRRLKKITINDSVEIAPMRAVFKISGNQGAAATTKTFRPRSKTVDLLDKNLLPDSAYLRFDSTRQLKLFRFDDYLQIIYTKEREKREYADQQMHSGVGYPTSLIWLINRRPVILQQNGLYFDPLDLFTSGYFAWEKLAEALPSDYEPGD